MATIGSNIEATYPIISIDQPSLGFRDNFGAARSEIITVQTELDNLESVVDINAADILSLQFSLLSAVISIDDLSDVNVITVTPSPGDSLIFNGTEWRPQFLPIISSITNLSDVDTITSLPVFGEILTFDGTNWVPQANDHAISIQEEGSAVGLFNILNFVGPNVTAVLDGGNPDRSIITITGIADIIEDTTPQLGGQLDAQANKIVSLLDPTLSQDAATKNYVDSVASGLDPKESVRVATVGGDLSTFTFTNNGGVGDVLTASGVGFTNVDSRTLFDGDRVLVKDRSPATQNGIYVASDTGSGGTTVLTRALDQDGSPTNELSAGNFTFVEEGTVNATTGWVVIGSGLLAVNVDNINWVLFTRVNGALTNIVQDITPQLGGNLDNNGFSIISSGSTVLGFSSDGEGAINSINISAALTSTGPTISAVGSDINIDLVLDTKGTGDIDASTNKIVNVVDPTINQDAATKKYVDDSIVAASGLSNIVEDTTPQLGGGLDVNGFNITMPGSETVDGRDLSVDGTKLDGIESGATGNQTASEILVAIKTVDGTGSGLDADLLDGNDSTAFATSAQGTLADNALQNIVEDTTPQLGGQLDINGNGFGDGTNLLLSFIETVSAVNHIQITNNSIGEAPIIRAAGSDTNIDLRIETKGSGDVIMGNPGSGVPIIRPGGADTNIDITLAPKGTGSVDVDTSKIINVIDPISAQDAATKKYVDDSIVAGAGLFNVVDDTTPQLGGGLDVNGFNITMPGSETVDGRDLSVDGTKLDNIEINATADQSASEILTAIKTVDGTGSELDADLLDGSEASAFAKKADNNTFTKAQRGSPVAIASSATITPDFNAGNNFEIDTIAINFTLANPTNMTNAAGQSGAIIIVQDGTGSRLLSAVESFWKFPGGILPVLSTAIGSVDTITYYVRNSTFIVANVILDAQ